MPAPSPLRLLDLLILTACAALGATSTFAAGPLQPVLQQAIGHHIMTGAVVLVADKDKVLDLEAVGLSSLATQTPMQPDSLFWIASMTKSVTATAFMMLVDQGKASIEDPVEKYLPDFKGQMLVEEKDKGHPRAPRHPITLKEVLSHTSGVVSAGDPALKACHDLKDRVEVAATIPLHFEPGTKFEYNNTGINIAGRVIEVISGQPYTDFLQHRLLDPLGMKDTTFWPTAEQAKRLAHSARFTPDKKGLEEMNFLKDTPPALITRLSEGISVPPEILADFGLGKIPDYVHKFGEPAGGLFSTAHDMGRLCQMLLNGGTFEGRQYLSHDAIRQMGSIQTGDILVNPQEGYGLAWFVKKRDDEGPSVGSYGHRGARRTVMWIDDKNQLAMVLLVLRMDMTGGEQKELYSSVFKAAVEKYGRQR
jgi:CubicO group peptidase (beta-lactamase class C family)